ncbi:orotate phosphoribosyltransferase [Methanobacterium sp.]|uniref:orotate phosphoribosyltransferase n=1 Tax=Methanobacterium sp. TaxID=2164 RepID=UPI003C76EB36
MLMNNEKKELIDLLKAEEVIKFGKFTLASGKESDYYVNMKMAITNPKILKQVAKIVTNQIIDDKIDKIAGPALGAVPIATAISLESSIPMLMIRKAKKGYGTAKLIEGELVEGDSVVVMEDVTTTGGSLIKAINAIKDNGGIVKKAIVVVDRAEGAVDNLKKEGIILEPLISIEDFKK